jgi:exopolysaccharide biosynthesis polyprenyl glycosylphosphotransferase
MHERLMAVVARRSALVAAPEVGADASRRHALIARWLTLADTAGAVAGLLLVGAPATRASGVDHIGTTIAAVAFVLTCVIGARAFGLHIGETVRMGHSTVDDLPRLAAVVTAASWIFVVARALLSLPPLHARTMLALWAASFAFIVLARLVARARYRRDPAFAQKTLIVGAGDVGQLVARKLEHHPELGLRTEGLVDDGPRERRPDLDSLIVLGGVDDLPTLIEERGIERVVIAFSSTPERRVLELIRSLVGSGVQVDIVPRLFETLTPGAALDTVEGLPLVSLPPHARTRRYVLTKRAIDVVGAIVGLVLALPLMLYIAWRIKRDSPGPVLFRQRRWGKDMREFTSLKFRTMKVNTSPDAHRAYIRAAMVAPMRADGGLFKLEREDAVTPCGRWLRRTSLDEIPQLFNVLRGDMSLVGPRPCIPYEVEHFAPHHFERFSVPQGLTGLWQVTARAHASFAEALDIDVAYARGCSLWLDLKLILLTPLQMRGEGATR